jgi:hypothetical protein
MPMPITIPPRSWLDAVFALITRPTSNTAVQRDTRTSPVSGSTRTSQNWAPQAAFIQRRWSRRKLRRELQLPGHPAEPERFASLSSSRFSFSHADSRLLAILAVCMDPPAPGLTGRVASPYSTRTASNGSPNGDGTTWLEPDTDEQYTAAHQLH